MTFECPAAKDMSAIWLPGPGRSGWGAVQTFVQLAPSSMLTSTFAVAPESKPKLKSMKSLAHWIAALVLVDRSIGGVTSEESSVVKTLKQLLLRIAYGPEPPVRFPSNWAHGSPAV